MSGRGTSAAGACRDTLGTATCGDAVTNALFDGTCFGFPAPLGGPLQRSMFKRTKGDGAACTQIRDGFGGIIFGTCEPNNFFCCVLGSNGLCSVTTGKPGTCKAASQASAACSIAPKLQPCATGLGCSPSNVCVANKTGPLPVGAACLGMDGELLGECEGGWCDVLGSSKCEAKKALGGACQGGDECDSGACAMGSCAVPTFCVK